MEKSRKVLQSNVTKTYLLAGPYGYMKYIAISLMVPVHLWSFYGKYTFYVRGNLKVKPHGQRKRIIYTVYDSGSTILSVTFHPLHLVSRCILFYLSKYVPQTTKVNENSFAFRK